MDEEIKGLGTLAFIVAETALLLSKWFFFKTRGRPLVYGVVQGFQHWHVYSPVDTPKDAHTSM